MDAHMKCEEHDTGAMSAEEGGWRYGKRHIDIDIDDVSDEDTSARRKTSRGTSFTTIQATPARLATDIRAGSQEPDDDTTTIN
jgi:hypothetical protein